MYLKLIVIALIIVTTFACGKKGKRSNAETASDPKVFQTVRSLNSKEAEYATVICQSFEDKRNNLKANVGAAVMNYVVSSTPCNSVLEKKDIGKKLAFGDPLRFDNLDLAGTNVLITNNRSFLEDIPTDTKGLLANVCNTIAKGDTPSNTEELNATESIQFQYYRQGDCGSDNKFTCLTTSKFIKQSNGVFENVGVEKWQVQTVSDDNLKGLIHSKTKNDKCSDSGESILKDQFIKI